MREASKEASPRERRSGGARPGGERRPVPFLGPVLSLLFAASCAPQAGSAREGLPDRGGGPEIRLGFEGDRPVRARERASGFRVELRGELERREEAGNSGLRFLEGGSCVRVAPGAIGSPRQLSIVLRVRLESLPRRGSALLAGFTGGPGSGCYVELYDDGRLSAWQCEPNLDATAELSRIAGTWHSVAAVFSGSRIGLYLDGEELAGRVGAPLPDLAGLPFLAGGSGAPSGGLHATLDGVLGEVLVYRRALGRAELAELARGGMGPVFSVLPQRAFPPGERPSEAPPPLPAGLEPADVPRPWGDSFLPRSRRPAGRLLVVDARPLGAPERLALTSLQALTSRERPRIWLLFKPSDRRWLEWHEERGHVDGHELVSDWRGLFRTFRESYRGAVIPDADLYRGVLLAANVAATDDLVILTPRLAADLGVEILEDLRGRFASYAQGLARLWKERGERFNPHLVTCAPPDSAFNGALGYDMQWRSFIFWIAGKLDGLRRGADCGAELSVVARILAELPPNTGVRGFPAQGAGIGLGETEGVRFLGGYGKILVPSEQTANISVMSGVRVGTLEPPEQGPAPPLESDRIYIALTISDGDNLNVHHDDFTTWFEHPAHGRFPVGWGMAPALLDLAPAIAEWYYASASSSDEFLADVSGMGYIFPRTYASRYRERSKVLEGFLAWTARYMEKLGIRAVRPYGADDATLERYAQAIPSLHSIFADYGRGGRVHTAREAAYRLPAGLPVFRALTDWRDGASAGLLDAVRRRAGRTRPAFVNAFVHCWSFDMDDLAEVFEKRDPDMVFVTPAQLASLFRKASVTTERP